GLLRVSRIRGLRTRIRDRVAVVHRRRGELGRNLERLRGARLGALVLVLVAEERATREKRERENGQNAKPRHETVSFSMQPASRSAASSASWCDAASGVSGRRMPSAMRPMRFSAHFTGMGLDSRNRFLCSGRSLLLTAI